MRGILFATWAMLLCALGLCAVAVSGPRHATASIPPSAANGANSANTPMIPCVYTQVQFSLLGMGTIEIRHPFTTTAGENYVQFVPAQPLTTTAASNGYALVNSDWSGN